ncbi:hypothetical protein CBR_g84879 [Chara braunii]|uniref:Uncharacterized protein n=1 Tax=Chara braunii TaxID=69332 RepID=A0A388KB40_CHABU|nr:hypothetical protein CBR_g84879 [Chara braunii]|eukprot:GBG67216.1 hypothetical protein CBR_g84879 [Chara braunii]
MSSVSDALVPDSYPDPFYCYGGRFLRLSSFAYPLVSIPCLSSSYPGIRDFHILSPSPSGVDYVVVVT